MAAFCVLMTTALSCKEAVFNPILQVVSAYIYGVLSRREGLGAAVHRTPYEDATCGHKQSIGPALSHAAAALFLLEETPRRGGHLNSPAAPAPGTHVDSIREPRRSGHMSDRYRVEKP